MRQPMKTHIHEITIGELIEGYVDDGHDGVRRQSWTRGKVMVA